MDQIRAFVSVVWRQRFWVLSVVAVVIFVVCWKMASSDVGQKFTAQKGKIVSAHGGVKNLADARVHGNESVNAKEREQVNLLAVSVGQLWQDLYRVQREQVLTWPNVLDQKFLNYIDRKKFGDSLSLDFRQSYANYINGRFPQLLEIVDAKQQSSAFSGGYGGGYEDGGGRGGDYGGDYGGSTLGVDEVEEDYLVQWYDQGELQQKLSFPNPRPAPVQIWVTQEDLWVYETLLQIIANVNEARGATRPDNTAISAIVELKVGSEAAIANQTSKGNIVGLLQAAGPIDSYSDGGAGGRPGGDGSYDDYGRGGGAYGGRGGGTGAMSAEEMAAMLLTNRYIDETGTPIDGDLSDPSIFGKEFRRLPVRMALKVDPKYIPTLLVECANAPLPVEVELLRINGALSGVGFESAAGGSGGGDYGRGGGGDYSGGRGDYGRGGASMAAAGDPQPGSVDLELQGVVYIYNPPDPAMLKATDGDGAAIAAN